MSKVLVTEAYLQDIADAIREKSGGGSTFKPSQMGNAIRSIPAGGGADWQVLYDGTTTAEAILRILISDISVKEVEVYALVPPYATDFVLYAPLMQTEATHYDKAGYTRMMRTITRNNNYQRFAFMKSGEVVIDGHQTFDNYCNTSGGEDTVRTKYGGNLANTVVDMTITSLAVATYVNTPAGTRIFVRGR